MSLPPVEYRLCRMLRSHAMEDYRPAPSEYKGPAWGRTFALLCTRCGTRRYVTIDSLGQISAQRYIYPDGYRQAGVPSTGDLRLDYVKRLQAERRARRRAS